MQTIAKQWKGGEFQFARTEEDKTVLWSARKEALWAMLAQRPPGTEIWSTDCAVPMSRLAEIIGRSLPLLNFTYSLKLLTCRYFESRIGKTRFIFQCTWSCRGWKFSSSCYV